MTALAAMIGSGPCGAPRMAPASAQNGNIQAARELLNRLVGRPPEGAEATSEETINRKFKLAERRLDLDEERQFNKMFGL